MKGNKQFEQFLSKAMYWCSKSEKATGDVLQKLEQWGVPELLRDSVIEKLKEENFINDERFAAAFANDKFRFNKWGKVKIKYALKNKMVSEYAISEGLKCIDPLEYESVAIELIQSKINKTNEPDAYKLKQKVLQFMASRGFESGMVFDLWDNINR